MVIREVIHSIGVHDAVTRSATTLEPGTILRSCRIRRHSHAAVAEGAEPYVVEFEAAGSRYECALVTFQPRTRIAGRREDAAIAV